MQNNTLGYVSLENLILTKLAKLEIASNQTYLDHLTHADRKAKHEFCNDLGKERITSVKQKVSDFPIERYSTM